jgi:hypothetical protein
MAKANIYTIFRHLIGDNAEPYSLPDFLVLKYLDGGIDTASDILNNTYNETKVITEADVANGYFELQHEIVVLKPEWGGRGVMWNYGGGKKIKFNYPDYFKAGQVLRLSYKARFNKFNGTAKEQEVIDLPNEAEMGVVSIAIGNYMRDKGVINANNEMIVQSKSEEGQSVSFATSMFKDLATPDDYIERGIDQLRSLPMADNIYFSVKM